MVTLHSFKVKSGKVLFNLSENPFGDHVVLDEPICGFDGMRCPSETSEYQPMKTALILTGPEVC